MSIMTFYTNPQSRGSVVSWMLAECGLEEGKDFTTVNLEYDSAESPNGIKSPDYLAVNPMGKVPALVVHKSDGDVVITECSAICMYLADAYPEKNLAPAIDSPYRGSYYRWISYTHAVLEAAVFNKIMGFEVPADKKEMSGYGDFDAVMDVLQSALAGKTYLCGDTFTTADLFMAAYVGWYMQWDMMPKLPEFEAYAGIHMARDAFKKTQSQ